MTKSTITRERLEEWVAQFDEDGGCDATDRQLEALIRQSLAALDSEPVAEVLSNRPGNDTSTIDMALPVGTQLYPQVQPVLVVPDELLKEYLRLVDCMLSDYRNGNYGDAQRWIRHIAKASDVFAEKHGLSPWEMAKKTFAHHPAHCACDNHINARSKWDYV
ncbi:hypothetical protein QAB11_002730 [Klebsiella pneumoniae]|uniref:hypothetical protein n=1 Tax=Klebsiella pneumoniae TaxID=573 RepID=UPI0025572732|nr:hypothetical protein [Klebsiella pneumoniae]MEC5975686.1 hypothetical protein [Klebsiella pneumoniae]HBY0103436.1 hypothetical protein [Klebsiella pneumoniae]HBY7270888.1 hypothetical protein [Klebsiella pneumoniae]